MAQAKNLRAVGDRIEELTKEFGQLVAMRECGIGPKSWCVW